MFRPFLFAARCCIDNLPRNSFPMEHRVAKHGLGRLRSPVIEMDVMLPRKTDAAVDLDSPIADLAAQRRERRTSRRRPKRLRPPYSLSAPRPHSKSRNASSRSQETCRRRGAAPPGRYPIGLPNCWRVLAYATVESRVRCIPPIISAHSATVATFSAPANPLLLPKSFCRCVFDCAGSHGFSPGPCLSLVQWSRPGALASSDKNAGCLPPRR